MGAHRRDAPSNLRRVNSMLEVSESKLCQSQSLTKCPYPCLKCLSLSAAHCSSLCPKRNPSNKQIESHPGPRFRSRPRPMERIVAPPALPVVPPVFPVLEKCPISRAMLLMAIHRCLCRMTGFAPRLHLAAAVTGPSRPSSPSPRGTWQSRSRRPCRRAS